MAEKKLSNLSPIGCKYIFKRQVLLYTYFLVQGETVNLFIRQMWSLILFFWYLAVVFEVMSISCLIIQQLDILISFLISYLLEYHNETMDLFWWRFNELWFILFKMINPKLLCEILLNADKIHIFYIIWKSKMGFLTRFWLQLM